MPVTRARDFAEPMAKLRTIIGRADPEWYARVFGTDGGMGDGDLDLTVPIGTLYNPYGPQILPPLTGGNSGGGFSTGLDNFFAVIRQAAEGTRATALDIFKTKMAIDAMKAQSEAGYNVYPVTVPQQNPFGPIDPKWIIGGALALGAIMLLKQNK